MIVHWPDGIAARGEIRHQYHHATDIVPTILDVVGIEMPSIYRGVEQYPLNGVSMRYSFDDAQAPTTKKRQYYAMIGTRGIWQDGWKAAAIHAPLSGRGRYDEDRWELYHVERDRAEAHDLAAEYPEKLRELVAAWFEEAEANFVLPLDDRPAVEQLNIDRPQAEPPRSHYVYYPDTAPVPEGVAVSVRGRSYKILADVEITPDSLGVLFAHGSRFGGHTLFVKDHRLHYVYNFLGIKPEQVFVSPELDPGPQTLGVEFVREGAGEHGESIGTARLYVGDSVVAEGPMRAQVGKFSLSGCGLCVGYAGADPISTSYRDAFRFTGGRIRAVVVDIGEQQYRDLEREAAAALARE